MYYSRLQSMQSMQAISTQMTKVTGIIGVTMKNMDVEAVLYHPYMIYIMMSSLALHIYFIVNDEHG